LRIGRIPLDLSLSSPICLLSSLQTGQVPPDSSLSSTIHLLSSLHMRWVPLDSISCTNVLQVHGSQCEALTPTHKCPTNMATPSFKV
jgi:hypothetical protein